MTEAAFRTIALSTRGAAEGSHMGHADFRIGGRIFASLWPDGAAIVNPTPEQQAGFVARCPAVFAPVKGAWGERGATRVHPPAARAAMVRRALAAAWRKGAKR